MKKRICAVIMCLLLAVNLVGVPKAKAVVSEGALLGSIFGSLLVSLGYSWAADNFDAPTFGEAIYDLIKQCDEEIDTGIQLLLDSNLAGLTAVGNGKLTFSQQWVKLANSFAEWFAQKYFVADNSSVVFKDSTAYVLDSSGNPFHLALYDYATSTLVTKGSVIPFGETLVFQNGWYLASSYTDSGAPEVVLYDSTGKPFQSHANYGATFVNCGVYISKYNSSYIAGCYAVLSDGSVQTSGNQIADSFIAGNSFTSLDRSLTAEKPQEVHYPEVAEDGSQVYEVTYQGVTATDIEGIIQGAVDRILAGTAAIAGEVTQAQDVPAEPEVPAAGEYAVPGLETIFPFCIPFDIYAFCAALNADPVAPSFEWRMQYAPLGLDYTFEIDLSDFDGVAQVLRTMELLAFCVGLAFWTRHLIRG